MRTDENLFSVVFWYKSFSKSAFGLCKNEIVQNFIFRVKPETFEILHEN